jgi:hypothetical protein
MAQIRSELLDEAILRLVDLPPDEQDRIAIEILAELCSEEEWARVAASEPYQKWLESQPEKLPEKVRAGLTDPIGEAI